MSKVSPLASSSNSDASNALSKIRDGIDRIDDEIADLLCRRADLAREVRNVKKGGQLSTYAPSREKEIVQRVLPKCLEAGFSTAHVEGVFLSVISACRSIVGDIEVCVGGFPGSQSYAAAIRQFGTLNNIHCVQDASQIFARLEQGFSQFALVPVSDGSGGICSAALDRLLAHDVTVVADRRMQEEYSIYSFEKDVSSVTALYGEGESLGVIDISRLELSNEMQILLAPQGLHALQALRSFLEKEKGSAIVAAPGLSALLGIPCLIERLPVKEARTARYYVLGKYPCPAGPSYRTALVCALKDTGGALRELLEPFSKHHVNLLNLESKHSKGAAWECMFFLELEGGLHEDHVSSAFRDIEKKCTFVKVLGSFPSGDI